MHPLNIKICIKLQTLKYCNRKLSKAGVSLLKPEPRIRGATDGVLNSVRTLPCHIIRCTHFMQRISNFFLPPPSLLELDVVVLYFSCSYGILYAILCSSFLVTHSVGRRMVYPGSVMLLQKAMWPMLLQGQAKLVEEVETTHTFGVCLCGKHRRC